MVRIERHSARGGNASWRNPASRFDASAPPAAEPGSRQLADTELLVPLLASGLNDKAIAHELGVSARMLDRRIVEFMKTVNARTRFQAGWIAALRSKSSSQES